eukprot:5382617-Lingulodinium_polyedra.AAC.1
MENACRHCFWSLPLAHLDQLCKSFDPPVAPEGVDLLGTLVGLIKHFLGSVDDTTLQGILAQRRVASEPSSE